EERAEHAVVTTDANDRVVADRDRAPLTGLREVGDAAGTHPGAGEDVLALPIEDRGRGVRRTREHATGAARVDCPLEQRARVVGERRGCGRARHDVGSVGVGVSLPRVPDEEPAWQWDETLFAGAAQYYERGRVPYAVDLPDAFARALQLDGRGRLLDV